MDPLNATGFIWCHECRTEAWPTDAAWMAPNLILATYPPCCQHLGAVTILAQPSILAPGVDRCTSLTRAGTQCRNRPMLGCLRCHAHQAEGDIP